VDKFTYLGITFLAGRAFRCDLQRAKIRVFRSLNGILGKVGTASPAYLTLSLIYTFCTPGLLFGLEALLLTKPHTPSLSYPYNSAYMKVFFTFDKEVGKQCKFYCGYLPFNLLLDLRVRSFYRKLNIHNANTTNVLFRWFGVTNYNSLAEKYTILTKDHPNDFHFKVWTHFEKEKRALS